MCSCFSVDTGVAAFGRNSFFVGREYRQNLCDLFTATAGLHGALLLVVPL